MDSHAVCCPNLDGPARGGAQEGNVTIHARTPLRYRCTVCGKTFNDRVGAVFSRRATDATTLTLILTLIAHGCPLAAIVVAFGVQRQTVADWLDAAGTHREAVHRQLVGQPRDLGAVQADEVRVKQQGRAGALRAAWLAMAMRVATRLWLGGVVSPHRDGLLIARLCALIRLCALPAPLLVCVDGFAASVQAIKRMARPPAPRDGRRGRCRLVGWSGLVIGQVVKRRQAGRVVGVTRRIAHGTAWWARRLLGGGTIQTASIERLNGTFRARLGVLARRTRGLGRTVGRWERGMWPLGAVDNFVTPHASLVHGQTPAMAAAGALWAGPTMSGAWRNCCCIACRRSGGDRRRNGEDARGRKKRSSRGGPHDHRSAYTYPLRALRVISRFGQRAARARRIWSACSTAWAA